MDIKLIKNFEEGIYVPVNKGLLIQMIDDNYQLNQFNGKKIFMFNPVTNERFEVLPEVKKYNMAEISYASSEREYFLFTSANRISDTQIRVMYYWYTLNDGQTRLIYTQDIDLDKLGRSIELKVMVLNENYCIFETVTYKKDVTGADAIISKGPAEYKLVMTDISSENNQVLENSIIAKSGIDKILPLDGNMCVIKIGSSLIEEKLYDDASIGSNQKEMIGIINVKQFISDIALNLDNIYMEVLDEGTQDITFPYIRQSDQHVVYSKVDVEKKIEEIIIYDTENKVKKVRLNSNISRVSDLSRTYIINDVPYVIRNTDKTTRLVNLNTQKTELKLNSDLRIKYIYNDMIVVQKHVKKMFFMRKENNYIEVFRFPDMHHPVFKTRAKYKDCLVHYDDLLIFTN